MGHLLFDLGRILASNVSISVFRNIYGSLEVSIFNWDTLSYAQRGNPSHSPYIRPFRKYLNLSSKFLTDFNIFFCRESTSGFYADAGHSDGRLLQLVFDVDRITFSLSGQLFQHWIRKQLKLNSYEPNGLEQRVGDLYGRRKSQEIEWSPDVPLVCAGVTRGRVIDAQCPIVCVFLFTRRWPSTGKANCVPLSSAAVD